MLYPFFGILLSPLLAALTSGGHQDAMIWIKGGYTPDVIVVEKGKPVRLNFVRAESASCSEMVLFLDSNKSAKLPEGETVPVEFMPDKAGEFEFQCRMGMLRGKLIVWSERPGQDAVVGAEHLE